MALRAVAVVVGVFALGLGLGCKAENAEQKEPAPSPSKKLENITELGSELEDIFRTYARGEDVAEFEKHFKLVEPAVTQETFRKNYKRKNAKLVKLVSISFRAALNREKESHHILKTLLFPGSSPTSIFSMELREGSGKYFMGAPPQDYSNSETPLAEPVDTLSRALLNADSCSNLPVADREDLANAIPADLDAFDQLLEPLVELRNTQEAVCERIASLSFDELRVRFGRVGFFLYDEEGAPVGRSFMTLKFDGTNAVVELPSQIWAVEPGAGSHRMR